ncbi:MAG: hypothetical protein N4A71_23700 [Carboxylicivirga sp.]|jgi:hypothetical protein|nr:hypothetical protein [Carboxylicivirga sp.]
MKTTNKLLKWHTLLLFSLISVMVTSQTRREVQFSLDTLYKSHKRLQSDYRKLLNQWKVYDAFYLHVKANVLDKEFINEPIDNGIEMFNKSWSGVASRMELFEDSTIYLIDSLNQLTEQNLKLMAQNETYLRLLTGSLKEAAYPNTEKELIGTWQLYLNPMQVEGKAYKSGIISHNPFTHADSLQQYNIHQLDVLPDELANIHFKDGRKQKCFYEVENFSSKKPYTIHCSKQDDFKMTIHISPMPTGLEVSYEIPLDTTQVLYFHGVMKP